MPKIEQGWASSDETKGRLWFHPDREPTELVIEDDQPFTYFGHWLGWMVRPCEEEGCQWCREDVGRLRRYVLAVQDPSGRHLAWEFGAGLGSALRDLGDLSGWIVRVFRTGEGRRGKLELEPVRRVPDHDGTDRVSVVSLLEYVWDTQKRFSK
jgi:hypothetical protein